MKNWKLIGFSAVASAALLAGAGASGRSAAWATPEGDAQLVAPAAMEVAFADTQPTPDAAADNGPGCVESALNR
jgi:hypothetical protein